MSNLEIHQLKFDFILLLMSNAKQRPSSSSHLPNHGLNSHHQEKWVDHEGDGHTTLKRNSMIPRTPLHKDPKVRQPKSNNIQKGQKFGDHGSSGNHNPKIPSKKILDHSSSPQSTEHTSKNQKNQSDQSNKHRKKAKVDHLPNRKEFSKPIESEKIETENDLNRVHQQYCEILKELASLSNESVRLDKEKASIEKSLHDYQKYVICLYTQIANAISGVEHFKNLRQKCSEKIKDLNYGPKLEQIYEDARSKCSLILEAKHLQPKERSNIIHYDVDVDINQFLDPVLFNGLNTTVTHQSTHQEDPQEIDLSDLFPTNFLSKTIDPESDLLSKNFKPKQKYSKYIL